MTIMAPLFATVRVLASKLYAAGFCERCCFCGVDFGEGFCLIAVCDIFTRIGTAVAWATGALC